MSIKPVSKTITTPQIVSAQKQDGLNRLGDTTLLHIFSYLSLSSSDQPSSVCRRWQRSILRYTPLDFSLRKSLLYSTRPREVQEKIDDVYLSLSEKVNGHTWLYDGGGGFYNYLGFKDAHIIVQRILNAPAQKVNLNFVSLGDGNFEWVDATRDLLCSKFKMSDRHFHVIGVSGDRHPHDEIEIRGNVTTHKISGFKIENLLDEFPKFKLNLVDSVEFIVCYWTLQHLVDYKGTLEQAFHLLAPGNGFLFGTGGEGESDSLNLKGLFGAFSYIANNNALGKLPLFALFRDKTPYHFSFGRQTFRYSCEEPLVEKPRQFDSYAKYAANLKWKKYSARVDAPFGGGFYGCGTYVLEKLLGQNQKTVKFPNGAVLQTSLFASPWFLKNYLDRRPDKGYDVELPEMSMRDGCNLIDLF